MKTIELSKKGKHKGIYFALVDDEDFEMLNKFKWHINNAGNTIYAEAKIDSKKQYMHRYILSMTDSKIDCDHIDRNGLNNQRSNLRLANRSQNSANSKKRINSTSIYKGVSYSKDRNKWVSHMTHNYKQYPLGRYNSEIEAAIAYNKKALELHGEFANLNVIPH